MSLYFLPQIIELQSLSWAAHLNCFLSEIIEEVLNFSLEKIIKVWNDK